MKRFLAVILALLLVFTLVSCGKGAESGENGGNGGKNGASDGKSGEDGDASDIVLEVEESDGKFIWKITDTVFYEIRHDGKNVTAYLTYIDYGSKEAAKEAVKLLNAIPKSDDSTVKSVTAKGQYIVYEYTEDGFEFKTYEEAKEAFDSANELLKQLQQQQ